MKKNSKVYYEVKVLKAHEVKDGRVVFDIEVNGVKVYGCWYIEYKNKEGKEGTMISFPSYLGNDEKTYYNHAWFPMSADVKKSIIDQLEKML